MDNVVGWLKRYWYWSVAAIFVTHTATTFYGLFHYHYLTASGGDMRVHLGIIRQVLEHPVGLLQYGYPPLYHLTVASFSRVTGINYVLASAYVTPGLVVASGLAVWFMADRLFGRLVGLATYLLYALVSLQPLQTASDGGLPTILGGHIILPLLIIAFVSLWRTRGWRWWLNLAVAAFLTLLLFLAHHLSTLIGLSVILTSLLPLLIWKLNKRTGRLGFSLLTGLIIGLGVLALAAYWFLTSSLLAEARTLAELFVSFSTHFPFVIIRHAFQDGPWSIMEYSLSINGLVFQAGLFGSLWLGWQVIRGRASTPLITFVLWWWILFIGSRLSWTGQPVRLARDLSLPSSVLAGYAVVELIRQTARFRPIQWIAVACLIPLITVSVVYKTRLENHYDTLVYVSGADTALGEYISTAQRPIYVWDLPGQLQFYLDDEQRAGKIIFIYSEDVATGLIANASPGVCLAAGYFQPGVWPEYFSDTGPLQRLGDLPNLNIKLLASDREKTWYILCKQ